MTSGGSLRLRLGVLAALAIVLALGAAQLGLSLLFERHVERRLGAELDQHLDQLAAAAELGPTGALEMTAKLTDPRFARAFGGLYWQVEDEKTGARRRSRSLWDSALALPADRLAIGEVHRHRIAGPRGGALLVHERRLILSSAAETRIVRFAAAIDRREIDALTRAFSRESAAGLALLALLLIAALAAQLWLGLRPLADLRARLSAVRGGAAKRLDGPAPSEIEPLVKEVNALLATHERSIEKARRRAADLAHGLNTPLTSLLSDARRLRDKGEAAIAQDIEETLRAMRRQVERELARARAVVPREAGRGVAAAPLIEALLRTLARTPDGERVVFDVDFGAAPDALVVAAGEEDLAEILGNLLENAARHASGRVRLGVRAENALICFCVEDDGPGVADHKRAAILDRGLRLDRSGAGAGIGLAIVTDVLERYGASLRLESGSLGGLRAAFDLPAASPLPSEARSGQAAST